MWCSGTRTEMRMMASGWLLLLAILATISEEL